MSQFFQDGKGDKEDESDERLMKYRIVQLEKAFARIPEALDEIKDLMGKIDTRMALGDKRMDSHSDLIQVIQEEGKGVREELRQDVKAAVESAVQNRGTFWAAMTGAITGVPAALYAVYLLFKSGPPPGGAP